MASNHNHRVVVTGLGAVTPLGNDYASSWQALLAGQSGIGPITAFDASDLKTQIGAEVKPRFSLTGLPAELRRARRKPSPSCCMAAGHDARVARLRCPILRPSKTIVREWYAGFKSCRESTTLVPHFRNRATIDCFAPLAMTWNGLSMSLREAQRRSNLYPDSRGTCEMLY